MQVVCTDGTSFQCEAYEVIDAGVMLFGEELSEEHEEERYASDKEQIGYVPHTALLYIIPDGATSQSLVQYAQQAQQPQGGAPGREDPSAGQPAAGSPPPAQSPTRSQSPPQAQSSSQSRPPSRYQSAAQSQPSDRS